MFKCSGYSAKKRLKFDKIRITFVNMTDLELIFKVWVSSGLVENGKCRFREQN